MLSHSSAWWTDDKVDEIVTTEYIRSQLRPDEQELLKQSPSFGAGLTDDTYLEWISTRAKRFFLILVEIGVPDQIFGVVDDSYDDNDLPIPAEDVPNLMLSYDPNKTLDKKFFKTQFKYLVRILGDGEHIRYAEGETVPINTATLKAGIIPLGKDATDKVRLPLRSPRVFSRRRVVVEPASDAADTVTEAAVLSEILAAKRYAHRHLLSVYGSYLQDDSVFVLFTPAPECSLKTFLSDLPKFFENLSKTERRETLINWPHCLANGLFWLHANARHHGAIRPSNIFVDCDMRIFFGQFDEPGIVRTTIKYDDVEAYQYAAPERWRRAVTMQNTGAPKTVLPSGSRTARKMAASKGMQRHPEQRLSWGSEPTTAARAGTDLDTANPTSTSYAFIPTSKGNFSRLKVGNATGGAYPFGNSIVVDTPRQSVRGQRAESSSQARPPSSAGYSALSSSNSAVSRTMMASITNPIFVAAPDTRTAVVQTWHSTPHDLFAADVFAVGAIILDIMTLLCKRSGASFSRHRSAKNRTAGRGGGLADASFHANIGQVLIWAGMLQHDASKKTTKEEGRVFRAVEPILELVKGCIDRDPEEWPSSGQLEAKLEERILEHSGLNELHCRNEWGAHSESRSPAKPTASSPPRTQDEQEDLTTLQSQDPPAPVTVAGIKKTDSWTKLRSQGLVTTTIPSPGPGSSLTSLSSFNFDAASPSKKRITSTAESKRWSNWHNNDSRTDPYLDTIDTGPKPGESYLASCTTSDDENEGHTFLLPPTRPASMAQSTSSKASSGAPDRPLPDIPTQMAAHFDAAKVRSHLTALVQGDGDDSQSRSITPASNETVRPRPPRREGNDGGVGTDDESNSEDSTGEEQQQQQQPTWNQRPPNLPPDQDPEMLQEEMLRTATSMSNSSLAWRGARRTTEKGKSYMKNL